MVANKITESYGKKLISGWLQGDVESPRCISVKETTNLSALARLHPWISKQKLVVKPDQGIKRRGALGLMKLNVTLEDAIDWIRARMSAQVEVDGLKCTLREFIIEPFLPHEPSDEHYVAIYSELEYDVILFHAQGGMGVGEIENKAQRLHVPLNHPIREEEVLCTLLQEVPRIKKEKVALFIKKLLEVYRDLHFTLLEINPLVIKDGKVHILDLAGRLDSNAQPLCLEKWGEVEWTKTCGREPFPEELHLAKLEAGTPTNLKLTVLNKKGRIWSGISGGGISLLLGDTALKMGCLDELGCYAQFSGPAEPHMMYTFFKTILNFMLEEKHPEGKVLITGSQAIDVLTLMKNKVRQGQGMFQALDEFKERLQDHKITLIIRSTVGVVGYKNEVIPPELTALGIPIYLFGGEVPVHDIIEYALGKKTIEGTACNRPRIYRNIATPDADKTTHKNGPLYTPAQEEEIFTKYTQMAVVNMMPLAIQGILNYDYICSRSTPSISAIVRPGSKKKEEEYLWGEGKVTIPVYSTIDTALAEHPQISVIGNVAFGPYAYKVAWTAIQIPQIRCIIMMVGHIPLMQMRELILLAKQKGVMMIGPSVPKHALQVNVFKPGALRCNILGDIGGPMPDVISLSLHRPGSVVMLSRSGGLSTELCVSIARNTDGLYLGISLGGGRYTGTGFMDHIKYLHENPSVKSFILIGEMGGVEEYDVCEALKNGKITKPVIAFCIGTCVTEFQQEPAYFGHTGGGIDVLKESSLAKNQALAEAGAIVPDTFDGIVLRLAELYDRFAQEGQLVSTPVEAAPDIPANMKPACRPPVPDS